MHSYVNVSVSHLLKCCNPQIRNRVLLPTLGGVAALGNYVFMESCNKDEKFMNMAEKANKNHSRGPEKLQRKAVAKDNGDSKHEVPVADRNFTRCCRMRMKMLLQDYFLCKSTSTGQNKECITVGTWVQKRKKQHN